MHDRESPPISRRRLWRGGPSVSSAPNTTTENTSTEDMTGEDMATDDTATFTPGAGVAVIKAQLKGLPTGPGVYRMLNDRGDALYVGKANSLKRRVTSYTQLGRLSQRLQRMVAETCALEVVTTHTEVEALLLESNLIKRLRPRYNILLRDDKSFPYILVTGDHPWPRIKKYRGPRSQPGTYHGPFASAGAVNRTLSALERAFLLRSCSDAVFAGRTRPCLKYQLKRCSAPCTDRIGAADYAQLLSDAGGFLAGRSREVQQRLVTAMHQASEALDYETAARFRDRINALTQVQAHQDINVEGLDLPDTDIAAAYTEGGQTCVQVFFFRGGRNYGNRAYFPKHDRSQGTEEVLSAFLAQFYENKLPPRLLLLSHALPEQALLTAALEVRAERKVTLGTPRRGAKRKLVDHAGLNAREALGRRLAESSSQRRLLERAAQTFGLDGTPARIEVYDNSHVSGTHAAGAMIVAGPDGFIKNAYRKFTIRGVAKQGQPPHGSAAAEAAEPEIAPGDDYAMMRQVLTRRCARALKEYPGRDRGYWPDLIMLDGGAGQLSVALEVFAELGIADQPVVAIAKGPDRDAGRERFFMPGRAPFSLEDKDPLLYFLQRLRDEAHRFAIGAHRAKRSKAIDRSPLDEIAGIGARRKRALLNHFGSARGVARAGLADLEKVDGISKTVARRLYDHFHGDAG